MSGKSLGDLYTTLTLKTEGWVKSINEAQQKMAGFAEGVAQVAGKTEEATGKMAGGFLAISGAAAAAFAFAATGSQYAKNSIEELQGVVRTLAIHFADRLTPLVEKLSDVIRSCVTAWDSLTDEQVENIVQVVKWSAIIGGVLMGIGKAAGIVKGFAEGFGVLSKIATPALAAIQSVLPALISSLLPVLPVVLAVGVALVGIGAAAAVIYDAWTDTSTGLREAVMGIFSSIGDAIDGIVKGVSSGITAYYAWLGSIFDGFLGYVKQAGVAIVSGIVDRVKQIAAYAASVARFLGRNTLADSLDQAQKLSAESVISTVGAGIDKATSDMRYAFKEASGMLNGSAGNMGDSIKDAAAKAKSVAADMAKTAREGLSTAAASARRGVDKALADSGAKEFANRFFDTLHRFMPNLNTSGDGVVGTGTLEAAKAEAEKRAQLDKETAAVVHQASLESQKEYLDSIKAERRAMDDLIEKEWAERKAEEKAVFDKAMGATEDMFAAILKTGEKQREAQKALAEKISAAKDYFIGLVSGRAGKVTGVVNSAMQGAAMGGPMGAVAGVAIDLITQSSAFKGLQEQMDNILSGVSEALGGLLSGLKPVLGAVSLLVSGVLDGLAPAFDAVGKLLAPLAPLIALVGVLLAPLFKALGWAINALVPPLTWLVNTAIRGLFEVIKGVGLLLIGIAKSIGDAWNGIVSAIQAILNALGDIEIFDKKPFDFLNDWAKGLDSIKLDTDGLGKAYDKLSGTTFEELTKASDERAESDKKAAAAADKLSDSLLNGARGWKVALDRFLSSDPGLPGGTTPTPTPSPTPGGGTVSTGPDVGAGGVVFNVVAIDPEQAAQKIENLLDKVDRNRGRKQMAARAE